MVYMSPSGSSHEYIINLIRGIKCNGENEFQVDNDIFDYEPEN